MKRNSVYKCTKNQKILNTLDLGKAIILRRAYFWIVPKSIPATFEEFFLLHTFLDREPEGSQPAGKGNGFFLKHMAKIGNACSHAWKRKFAGGFADGLWSGGWKQKGPQLG